MTTFRQPGAYPLTTQTHTAATSTRGRNSIGVKRATTYPTDRRCTKCDRSLSRYNPDGVCAACNPPEYT